MRKIPDYKPTYLDIRATDDGYAEMVSRDERLEHHMKFTPKQARWLADKLLAVCESLGKNEGSAI